MGSFGTSRISRFAEVIRAHTNDPDWHITDDSEVVYETFRMVDWTETRET